MYKKIGLIFSFLFFCHCNSSFSRLIREQSSSAFLFSVSLLDSIPIIELNIKLSSSENSKFKKLRFVVDTGSNVSMISDKFFHISNKSSIKKMSMRSLSSISEIEYFENFFDLRFEDRELQLNKKILLTKFPDHFMFDGILGNDFISDFNLILNFPRSIVLIKKNQKIKFEDYGFVGFPLEIYKNYIIIDGFINGSDLIKKFVLDTGSGISYLTLKPEEKEKFIKSDRTFFYDSLGSIRESETRNAGKVCIITKLNCLNNAKFLSGEYSFQVNESRQKEIFGLIGINWILNREYIINYTERKIYFRK